MRIRQLHSWNLTPKEAVALQRKLAGRIDTTLALHHFDLIAGADVSYNRFSTTIHAGVVVWRRSDGLVVERQAVQSEMTFPYVPGLLTFREGPAVLEAFRKLRSRPDAVICDGQGIAHPRRIGLASHIGLWLDLPTVGCAKTRFIGEHKPLPLQCGVTRELYDCQECIGAVVRTKSRVKPLFVSPGHLIDRASAIAVVLATVKGYRVPEPTRLAHLYVNEQRRRAFSIH
jgi:deoxyribonuclease V